MTDFIGCLNAGIGEIGNGARNLRQIPCVGDVHRPNSKDLALFEMAQSVEFE